MKKSRSELPLAGACKGEQHHPKLPSVRRTWGRCGPFGRLAILAAVLLLWGSSIAPACSTPVYRYAMYNWAPAPYYVFYFHDGEPDEKDAQVNQTIDALGVAEPAANVVLQSVDLSEPDQLDRLPEIVKKSWESHQEEDPPAVHLVYTAWGAEVFAGRLDAKAVKAMVDSPARKRLAELLDEGNATVMMLLGGPDAAENERAEKVIAEVIKRAAAGSFQMDPYLQGPPPPGDVPGAPADDGDAEAAAGLPVAVMKLSRSDPAETWLIRSLMAIEPDLEEYAKEPMIFGAYGRGRAMEPYIGKGITVDNLTELVMFLTGACSCMVKEQNPGADLLMHWDWDATADTMAATDPAFSGGQFAYQEFSPDETGELVPSAEPEAMPEAAETEPGVEPGAEPQSGQTAGPEPNEDHPAETPPTAEPGETPAKRPDANDVRAQAGPPVGKGTRSFVGRQMWTFGVGFAVAVTLVLTAGFFLIRKQA